MWFGGLIGMELLVRRLSEKAIGCCRFDLLSSQKLNDDIQLLQYELAIPGSELDVVVR